LPQFNFLGTGGFQWGDGVRDAMEAQWRNRQDTLYNPFQHQRSPVQGAAIWMQEDAHAHAYFALL
jgi:hypothetical protein